MDPQPTWRLAVKTLAERLNEEGLPYKVVGGVSAALHGVPVPVRDIDVETDECTAYLIQRLFAAYTVQPVALVASETYRSHLGRLRLHGVVVEIMGDLHRREGESWVPTYTRTEEYIELDGIPVRVSWLEEEVLAYIRRGRLDRAAECLPYCNHERLLALIKGIVQPGVI